MAAHDVFTVGQYKDDQTQSHNHSIAHTHNINHTHSYTTPAVLQAAGDHLGPYAIFWGSGSATTGGPSNMNSGGPSNEYSGLPGCRNGTVTRGKRKGVNYIIKA